MVDDIEDIHAEGIITERSQTKLTVRARKTQNDTPTNGLLSSYVPGTQSIYVRTWGCTHNTSDSEYMAGQLSAYGYRIVTDKLMADLWLLNSCTVKNPAEDHFRNEVNHARELGKLVVVAGCVSQATPKAEFIRGVSIVGVQQIDRVVEVVEETFKGNTVRLLGKKKATNGHRVGGADLDLPKIRRNAYVEIIPISTGCLNQCTYCKTKHARGQLGSYPPSEIVQRAQQAFAEGVVEVWLTSEDTGAYGRDIGCTLPSLLWKLIEVVPEKCRIRVGMTNPPYILEHLDEMVKILDHKAVYSFLHIPVQSGSDVVLGDMKREYCRADFEQIVDFLRERIPRINIATDIICGFPTETDADFQETLDLCSKYRFASLFINQYFPRPGTPAARMQRKASPREVKQRTKSLTDLFHSYLPYQHGYIGRIEDVLVTDISHDSNYFVGHTKFYEQVLVPKDPSLMGKMVRVRIHSTSKFSMMATVLDNASSDMRQWLLTQTTNKIYLVLCILFVGLAVFLSKLMKWVYL